MRTILSASHPEGAKLRRGRRKRRWRGQRVAGSALQTARRRQTEAGRIRRCWFIAACVCCSSAALTSLAREQFNCELKAGRHAGGRHPSWRGCSGSEVVAIGERDRGGGVIQRNCRELLEEEQGCFPRG